MTGVMGPSLAPVHEGKRYVLVPDAGVIASRGGDTELAVDSAGLISDLPISPAAATTIPPAPSAMDRVMSAGCSAFTVIPRRRS